MGRHVSSAVGNYKIKMLFSIELMQNFGQRQGISEDLQVWSAQMGFSSFFNVR